MFLLIVLILVVFTGCVNKEDDYFVFGVTTFSDFYGGNQEKAKQRMKNLIIEVENLISPIKKGSDVYRINNAKVGEKIVVSDITKDILKLSKDMYEETEECFNISLYNASILWGFDPSNEENYSKPRKEPSKEELESIKNLCNMEDIVINGNVVTKKQSELKIDLGGIAKGYLADKCNEIAKEEKLKGGILNLGGNIYLLGEKDKKDGNYTIGITNPRKEKCENTGFFAKISTKNTSIVTSGDYNRYYMYDGKRYHHILDGRTLKPTNNGVASVTIVNRSSALCDAYSTAVFVMGIEKGKEFLNEKNIDAIIITDDLKYVLTGNINSYIKDIHKEFIAYE